MYLNVYFGCWAESEKENEFEPRTFDKNFDQQLNWKWQKFTRDFIYLVGWLVHWLAGRLVGWLENIVFKNCYALNIAHYFHL